MTETVHTDVLIVGAGSAGLAAAVAATEGGAGVVVVDKASDVGGPSKVNPASLGMFAADSWMQRERHVDLSVEEAFRILMEHTHWRTDARVVSAYVRNTAPTIAWFNRLGIHFDNVVAYYTGAKPTWHIRHDPENPVIADVLAAYARDHGASIELHTRAERLLTDDGRVVGAVTTDREGVQREIRAGATIVATGGYQGSPELIHEFTGLTPGEDLFTYEMFTHEVHAGEGLRMAWDAGAARAETMLETYIYLPDPYGGPGGTAPELSTLRQPNLLVNQHGLRFVDESLVENPADAANALRRQPGKRGYMIVSGDIDEYYRERGLDFQMYQLFFQPGELPALGPQVADARAAGYANLFHADSVAELADAIGAPADELARTVAAYNEACVSGRDEQFFKSARYLRPIRAEHGLYAARFQLGSYGSSGGIAINEHGQALDDAARPVPGLYASGRDANTLYGGTYPFVVAGQISGFSYTMGRLAGAHAALTAAENRER